VRIYKGYVLALELAKKANKSAAWVNTSNTIKKEYMGSTPVVKVSSLSDKYKKIAIECQDLENYYSFAPFSIEIGRMKDFMSVLEYQRKKSNKKPFETKKIFHYKLLKLSDDFIKLVNQGFSPYKLHQNCNKLDYKHIITMQDMEIGFY
jgi:hypothetical protein